jgi:hypothetical protein
MTRRILLPSVLSLTLLSVFGTSLWADHGHDPHDAIRAQAASLVRHSSELYEEIRLHFRGHPETPHALSDALNMLRSARRMAGYADVHASFGTMEREASRMEDAFHHLEETLRSFGYGHGHRHVRELVRHMDDLVHEIHDDVHHLRRGGYYPASYGRVDLGPSDWYFGGGGFSIRLGR